LVGFLGEGSSLKLLFIFPVLRLFCFKGDPVLLSLVLELNPPLLFIRGLF